MQLTSLGTVIAERHIRDETGETAFVVKVGLPQQFPDGTDFYCPIQVSAAQDTNAKVLYSAGIDSVQALQLSMTAIGAILFGLNQQCGGKLRWDGDENGDLGFPTPD